MNVPYISCCEVLSVSTLATVNSAAAWLFWDFGDWDKYSRLITTSGTQAQSFQCVIAKHSQQFRLHHRICSISSVPQDEFENHIHQEEIQKHPVYWKDQSWFVAIEVKLVVKNKHSLKSSRNISLKTSTNPQISTRGAILL